MQPACGTTCPMCLQRATLCLYAVKMCRKNWASHQHPILWFSSVPYPTKRSPATGGTVDHCGTSLLYREVYRELFGTRRSDFLQRSPPRPASTSETRKSFPDPSNPSNPSASRLQKVKDSSSFCHSQPSGPLHNSPHSGITLLHHQAVSNHRTPQRVRCGLLIQFNMMCEFKEQMSVWILGSCFSCQIWLEKYHCISLLLVTANLQTSKTNIYRTRQNSSYVSCANPSMVGLSGTPTPRHPFVSPHGRCRHWHTCCTWCVRRGLP